MTTFDPAQFIDMQTDQALTKRPPLPVGDYTALIGTPDVKAWNSKDGTKSGLRMAVPLRIQVPTDVQSMLGLNSSELTLTDSVFLDQNSAGGLDFGPGRNSGLRRYREALGQNVAGQPWSIRRLEGQPIRVKVSHDTYNGDIVERVDGVAKAG